MIFTYRNRCSIAHPLTLPRTFFIYGATIRATATLATLLAFLPTLAFLLLALLLTLAALLHLLLTIAAAADATTAAAATTSTLT